MVEVRVDSERLLQYAIEIGAISSESATELNGELKGLDSAAAERVLLEHGSLKEQDLDIMRALAQPDSVAPAYQVLSLLGRGGMGVVYKASQLTLQRTVALKTIPVGNCSSAALARFEGEAQTLARVVHPHIVSAIDYGRHNGRVYLAMEYIEGKDAHHTVKESGPFATVVAWGIVRQAASGLALAAEQGIVHRDIKPANLLLTACPPGYPLPAGWPLVKIVDFGLALLTNEVDERTRLTSHDATVGSPHYMAPEQFDSPSVDLRADIYSLGATAWHLLTGKQPYGGLSMQQIVGQKVTGKMPGPPELRATLDAASLATLEWMMAQDAQARPQNYGDLLRRIDATIEQVQSGMTRPRRSGATPSVAQTDWRTLWARRKWLLAAGASAVLALPGWVWFSRSQPETDPDAEWVPDANPRFLFDGEKLKPWKVTSGNWGPYLDPEEGDRWLAGKGGMLTYAIPAAEAVAPYAVELVIDRRNAEFVELVFGDEGAAPMSRAWVLRLDEMGIRHAVRRRGETTWSSNSQTIGGSAKFSQSRVGLRLERRPRSWRVMVQDEPVLQLPDQWPAHGTSIVLGAGHAATEPGACFGEIQWMALRRG